MPHEPKKRHSKAKKRTRQSAIKLETLGLITCTNCKEPALPHQACKNCGFYGGKKVSKRSEVKVTKV